MNIQSTKNTITSGVISIPSLNKKRTESAVALLKNFNYEEMRTCQEAAMSLSKLDTFGAAKEKLFSILRTDFEVLGNMMSGSSEHYTLIEKLNSLTEPEQDLLVVLCHQYWHGEEDKILQIGQLVNDNCHSIDLWPNGKAVEHNKISGDLDVTLDFESFVTSVCNKVDCMDITTSFSIPSSLHNSMLHVEILRQMIERLGYQVLHMCPVEEFSSDNTEVAQVNYVIDTNLPIHIYFSLISEEAA
ncbi:MAG: hypothetical protein ACJAS1_001853 [Oleiphilaceae bacterium]|jgi:hypothetical protein